MISIEDNNITQQFDNSKNILLSTPNDASIDITSRTIETPQSDGTTNIIQNVSTKLKEMFDNENNLTTNESPLTLVSNNTLNTLTKQQIVQILYLLSHIVFATILVICLKNINPILLFLLLFGILSYISYEEQQFIPFYTLFIIGAVVYLIDLFITKQRAFSEISIYKHSVINTLKNTLWKLPYYGILSYYLLLYVNYVFRK